jgi:hypothetical protein
MPKPTDPAVRAVVWRWNHQLRTPVRVVYLGRRHTWRSWARLYDDREGPAWNENGLRPFFFNPTNCAWDAFSREVNTHPSLRHAQEAHAERCFALACEYVRQFSNQFQKPPSEVWAKSLTPEKDTP